MDDQYHGGYNYVAIDESWDDDDNDRDDDDDNDHDDDGVDDDDDGWCWWWWWWMVTAYWIYISSHIIDHYYSWIYI